MEKLFRIHSLIANSKCVPIDILLQLKDHEGRTPGPEDLCGSLSLNENLNENFFLLFHKLGNSTFFLIPSYTHNREKQLLNVLSTCFLSFKLILLSQI